MRTLAQRLDSGTATLYRHFTGRADLIAHVVDLVFGSVEIDAAKLSAMPWRRRVKRPPTRCLTCCAGTGTWRRYWVQTC